MDISLKNVEYRYQADSPFERLAISDVSIDIPSGTYLAVIGHTGSGKSTVLQHLNALLKPTKGSVLIGSREIKAGRKEKNLKGVREKVGIVFQFPEHQLFEETVEKDIMFGPMNFGVTEADAKARAIAVLKLVGLPEDILEKSPFDLSGGQMRRVAIAGVLAMEPEVIVLDEPTAGLDPRGRKEIMDLFYTLHKKRNLSTVLVTHSMEDAARYADEIVVMHQGKVFTKGTPEQIFADPIALLELGLDVPEVVGLQLKIEKAFDTKFSKVSLSEEELAEMVAEFVKGGGQK
ncbi:MULTISPECIES: energy-coupling factor ABC transporter ATP-binding protein [unclassified Mesobacillus]|uniref:energy-coupling factor ABC transporter ATP-binding protein n=1 Tax=unclassified Mesobacillus TaxID=2675270 RepID=UPI00203A8C84|nr:MULTISPECIES: energy-coupling factor ABC transporter ATP-binding protein [unclassified Mesobacillus]MCM3125778.1 energy-coupling factor ABC transporter ATP-binding protein [Mesobacillus sp. MER 33]MCM3235799.1 energy-coupling factor ABC transporter ATP-binding protein [Mesobacillus sp. MER 48]